MDLATYVIVAVCIVGVIAVVIVVKFYQKIKRQNAYSFYKDYMDSTEPLMRDIKPAVLRSREIEKILKDESISDSEKLQRIGDYTDLTAAVEAITPFVDGVDLCRNRYDRYGDRRYVKAGQRRMRLSKERDRCNEILDSIQGIRSRLHV